MVLLGEFHTSEQRSLTATQIRRPRSLCVHVWVVSMVQKMRHTRMIVTRTFVLGRTRYKLEESTPLS